MESRVREGDRSARERNRHEWTVVGRRTPKPPPKPAPTASRTCFVDFLPMDITIGEIEKIFNRHGKITHIFIPTKIRPNRQRRYAFVQYLHPKSLTTAIQSESGRIFYKMKLRVYPAKKDHPLSNQKTTQSSNFQKSEKIQNKQINPSIRDHRLYSETLKQSKPMSHLKPVSTPQPPPPLPPTANHNEMTTTPTQTTPNPQDIPPSQKLHQTDNQPKMPQIPEPIPEFIAFEPSYHRRMSSRALGSDTEKYREELLVDTVDNENMGIFKISKCNDNAELFERSVIGVASSSLTSQQILDHIIEEGVLSISIKPLGGMLHLISFETIEEKQAFIECNWLDRWFIDIRNVNSTVSSQWKQTWIRIYGLPLSAWGYDNIYKIGCLFGRVLSVDHSNFEYARILIFTDILFSINCKLAIDMEGKIFTTHIYEDSRTEVYITKPEYSSESELDPEPLPNGNDGIDNSIDDLRSKL